MLDDYKEEIQIEGPDNEIIENSYLVYLNEVLQYDVLSREEEISLFARIQDGDDIAKDLFIKSNLRLVIQAAYKYFKPGYNQLLDLIQEGNIGLLQAVERYDPSRGVKFSTYAFYWIKKTIWRSCCCSGFPVELSQRKSALVHKLRRTYKKIENECGAPPSPAELAEVMDMEMSEIELLLPFVYPSISLNYKPQEDHSEKEIVDFFSEYYSENANEVEYSYIIKETREEFRRIIFEALSEKEVYVLFSRQGLYGTPIKDVKTLAEELGMSEQGVRQTEDRCLTKLRKYLTSLDKTFTDFVF